MRRKSFNPLFIFFIYSNFIRIPILACATDSARGLTLTESVVLAHKNQLQVQQKPKEKGAGQSFSDSTKKDAEIVCVPLAPNWQDRSVTRCRCLDSSKCDKCSRYENVRLAEIVLQNDVDLGKRCEPDVVSQILTSVRPSALLANSGDIPVKHIQRSSLFVSSDVVSHKNSHFPSKMKRTSDVGRITPSDSENKNRSKKTKSFGLGSSSKKNVKFQGPDSIGAQTCHSPKSISATTQTPIVIIKETTDSSASLVGSNQLTVSGGLSNSENISERSSSASIMEAETVAAAVSVELDNEPKEMLVMDNLNLPIKWQLVVMVFVLVVFIYAISSIWCGKN